LKKEQKSVGDFKDVSYAAELYSAMRNVKEEQGQQHVGVGEPEPQLSDYYQPSEEQRKYKYICLLF